MWIFNNISKAIKRPLEVIFTNIFTGTEHPLYVDF